jgi:peptide-methionine (S)-S-oxide reductase
MENKIVIGGGCFWCIEAVFQRVEGVISANSGYIDGHIKNPTYREVCTGTTGHNEVVELVYDASKVTLEELLEIFWSVHNPTTLNQQGADKGTQYRSGIYYYNDEDLETIQESINNVAAQLWEDPIVTEVKKATKFYIAEKYHQDYYNRNDYAGYCQIVINPKLGKLRAKFAHKIKEEYSENERKF